MDVGGGGERQVDETHAIVRGNRSIRENSAGHGDHFRPRAHSFSRANLSARLVVSVTYPWRTLPTSRRLTYHGVAARAMARGVATSD